MNYFRSLAQRASFAHANCTAREPDLRQHRQSLTLIVQECDVLRVRRAVIQHAGGRVEIVRCVPIRKTANVRLTIELQAGALDAVFQRIMRSIETGEFGRVGLAP